MTRLEEITERKKQLNKDMLANRAEIEELDKEQWEIDHKKKYEAQIGKCFGYELRHEEGKQSFNMIMYKIISLVDDRTFNMHQIRETYAIDPETAEAGALVFRGVSIQPEFFATPEHIENQLPEIEASLFDETLKQTLQTLNCNS